MIYLFLSDVLLFCGAQYSGRVLPPPPMAHRGGPRPISSADKAAAPAPIFVIYLFIYFRIEGQHGTVRACCARALPHWVPVCVRLASQAEYPMHCNLHQTDTTPTPTLPTSHHPILSLFTERTQHKSYFTSYESPKKVQNYPPYPTRAAPQFQKNLKKKKKKFRFCR